MQVAHEPRQKRTELGFAPGSLAASSALRPLCAAGVGVWGCGAVGGEGPL